MKRKEIFKKLEKDLKPRVEYNYKKTAKGIHIMKRTNEATEKVMLKDLVNRFNEFEKKNDQRWEEQNKRWEKQEAFNSQVFEFMQRQDEFNKNQEIFNKSQLEFNKAIMQRLDNVDKRLDNIVTKNNLSE